MPIDLGSFLTRKREEKGWSQRELARKANVSFMTIQAIERGDTLNPGFKTVKSLAKALNVNLYDFSFAMDGIDPDSTEQNSDELAEEAQIIIKALSEFRRIHRKQDV